MRRGDGMKRPKYFAQAGFTLVEAIVVIAITGIIGGMVAVFLRGPIDAYFDTARRAELTDVADTAVRRVAREVQSALPNSVRVDGTGNFLEFIPIRTAGRYRVEVGRAVVDDPLDFSLAADNAFDVLGPPVTVLAGDSLVVYNLGLPGVSSAYDTAPLSSRRVATAGAALAKITFTPTAAALPLPSPGSRFQIVGTPVSYACDLGSGTLWRFSGYAIQSAQATTVAALNALPGVVAAPLATGVTACAFAYTPGVLQRSGLVSMALSIAQSGETIVLQHQINVDNTP